MPTSATTSASAQSGYTLTELVVVLVIIGLTLAIAAPRLFSTSDADVIRTSAQSLEMAARSARTSARLTGRETILVVDVDRRTASIEPDGPSYTLPGAVDIVATVAEAELDGELAGVRFFPEGGSTGGNYRLTAGESGIDIRIDWITGLSAREQPGDDT